MPATAAATVDDLKGRWPDDAGITWDRAPNGPYTVWLRSGHIVCIYDNPEGRVWWDCQAPGGVVTATGVWNAASTSDAEVAHEVDVLASVIDGLVGT
jgi:hypothetical protein